MTIEKFLEISAEWKAKLCVECFHYATIFFHAFQLSTPDEGQGDRRRKKKTFKLILLPKICVFVIMRKMEENNECRKLIKEIFKALMDLTVYFEILTIKN